MKTKVAIAGLCVGVTIGAAALGVEIDAPYWLDPAVKPEPDGTTVLLWRFEDGAAGDATAGGNNGRAMGEVKPAEGRYGGGLRFGGGDQAVALPALGDGHAGAPADPNVLIVDFWCRVESAPKQTACLLHMPGQDGLRLDLTPAMGLRLARWTGGSVAGAGAGTASPLDRFHGAGGVLETASRVPVGAWFHVALLWSSFVMPSASMFSDGGGVELLIDGESAGVANAPGTAPTLPQPMAGGPYLCLGNSLKRDAGFAGLIDEFRVSRGAQGVYPVIRQASVPAGAAADSPVGTVVWRQSFDEAAALQTVTPPQEPVFPQVAPPIVALDAQGRGLSLQKGSPNMADELVAILDRDTKGAGQPVQLTAGVAGQALQVRGGAARLDLPVASPLTNGTLAFWFRPGNWANLAVPAESASYLYRRAHVLTLWGTPVGGGKAEVLFSLDVNRLGGGAPIRPEYRKRFGQPAAGLRVVPHEWRHVRVTWSERFPHLSMETLDGIPLALGKGKAAPPETWKTHRPAYVTLGNEFETAFDDLRLYDHPFERPELRTASQAFESLGDFPIAAGESILPLITGTWRKGWVTGVQDQGAARAFFGFRPEIGEMIVAVAPNEPAAVAQADIAFQAAADRAVKAAIPAFSNGLGGVIIPVGKLSAGDYRLEGKLLDAAGKPVGAFASTFVRVPTPQVEDDRLGLLDNPPEPFTPVEVQGQTVRAVGRVHRVGADGFYEGIEVLGEQILAAPIRLEAQVDGKPVALAGKGVRFGASQPTETSWEGSAEGAGLRVRTRARFEYDGLAKYDIEVEPLDKEARIERLSLLIPLKDAHAQLFHALPPSGGLRRHYSHGGVKPGEGLVWDSLNDFMKREVGAAPPAQMWLGGPVRGLVWCAENHKGWVSDTNRPAMTLTRAGDVLTLGVHLVDRPLAVNQPRRIAFQLLGTPPKPLPRNYRAWNRGDLEKHGKVTWRITSCDSFAPWAVFCRDSTFAYWPPDDDWDLVRLAVARQGVGDNGKYPAGAALMMYHDLPKTPFHPAIIPYYGWNWGPYRYPRPQINHMIWYMNKMIECGYDGVYIDDVFPGGSWNLEPFGPAYEPDPATGLTGKQCGSEAGQYRDYFKRLYGLFVSHNKPPLITTHMSTTLGWPYHTFATVAFDGEDGQRFDSTGLNGTFIDAWPLEYLLTFDVAERSGLVTVFMLKDKSGDDRRSPMQLWARNRSHEAIAYLFDHNNGAWPASMAAYSAVDVEVLPFWRNGHLAKVEPLIRGAVEERDLPQAKWWKTEHLRRDLARQPLRATLYKKKDGVLLIVGNFLRRAVGARVTLDLAALGVPADARGRLRVVDTENGRPPGDVNLATFHLADNVTKETAAPKLRDLHGENLLAADKAWAGLDAALDEPGDRDAAEAFYAIKTNGGAIELQVGPHNYRAVELTW